MLRRLLIAIATTAVLGTAMTAAASTADAHRRHHSNFTIGIYPFGFYNGYGSSYNYYPQHRYRYYAYDDYYDDCGFRRVLVKKWNKAHTKRIKVYQKQWTCY